MALEFAIKRGDAGRNVVGSIRDIKVFMKSFAGDVARSARNGSKSLSCEDAL